MCVQVFHRRSLWLSGLLGMVFLAAGCSAPQNIKTPPVAIDNMRQALRLLQNGNVSRPQEAAELMDRAYYACEFKRSQRCFADLYSAYGQLTQSPAFVAAYKKTTPRRDTLSVADGDLPMYYLDKAEAKYKAIKKLSGIPGVMYGRALYHLNKGDPITACSYLDDSLLTSREIEKNGTNVPGPDGKGSYQDFYRDSAERFGCGRY